MDIKTNLRQLLAGDEDIAALVAGRVYLAAVPAGADRPHIVLTVTDTERLKAGGQSQAWTVRQIEVASVASSRSKAAELAGKVFSCLADHSDDYISDVDITGEYDAPNLDGSQDIFAVVQVYQVAGNL